MKYWTNFAKSGDPNRDDDGIKSNTRNNESSKSWITQWENYDERQKVLDLGIRPHSQHHYRGHKMSVWLNLIPQLQKTGQHAIFPSHNSLTTMNNNNGPTWGVVLPNASIQSQPSVLHPAPSGGGATFPSANCITLADSQQVLYQQNDTLIRLEEASRNAYSYALGITVGLGSVLCLLNGVLIVCLCTRNSQNGCCGSGVKNTTSSNASSRSPSLSSANSRIDMPYHERQLTPHQVEFSSLPRRGGQRTLLLTQRQTDSRSRSGSTTEISTFTSSANSGHATVSRRTMPKPILRDKSHNKILTAKNSLPDDTIPAPAEFDPIISSSSILRS
nr:neuroligin 4-like [Lepeophtheirus salmonis]